MFFGRIQKYKGVNILCEAYEILSQRYNNITLTIAGKGEIDADHKSIEQNNSVKIINRYIPDDEVDDFFLVDNTILVLPYVDSSQSGVLSIAYKHGVPVIASNTSGLVEQLNHGKNGIIVLAGNTESLVQGMEKVLKDFRYLEEESEKMKKYSDMLSPTTVCKQLLEQIAY